MSRWTQRFLGALCLFLVGTWGCASPNDGTTTVEAEVEASETRPLSEIELERKTLFFDRDSGVAIAVAPGIYRVEALEEAPNRTGLVLNASFMDPRAGLRLRRCERVALVRVERDKLHGLRSLLRLLPRTCPRAA